MKHTTLSDCLPLICILAVGASACTSAFEDAKYARNVDCAFHVLDNALDHNDELIGRVLSVGQGPFLIEEYVEVMAELGKSDTDIIAVGKELRACIPQELLE